MKVSVFDYGAGNLQSVKNTLAAIGAGYELIRDSASIRAAERIILPGVGHFGQIMQALDELQVREALVERIKEGVPFLGICLGLQALFSASEEEPEARGLGIYPGTVRRFEGDARIPHMGWNHLDARRTSYLLEGTGDKPYVYFANSYYCPVIEATAATTEYLHPFTALLEQGTIAGVQFHPERSGPVGLRMVRNFVEHDFAAPTSRGGV